MSVLSQAKSYMFKVNNRDPTKKYETFSELTRKTPKRFSVFDLFAEAVAWRCSVINAFFKHFAKFTGSNCPKLSFLMKV